MKLSIFERLMLAQVLPSESDFTTMRIVRDLRGELSFSEEEHKKYNIRSEENENGRTHIVWNNTDDTKEVNIGPKAHAIILEALEKLNKEKKLTETHLSVYEKFVEGKPSNDKESK